MTETTPRPWRVISKEDITIKGHVCSTGGDDQNNQYFVQGSDYYEGGNGAKADAELIVRAVNSHDDLVAALEAVEWSRDAILDICPDCGWFAMDGHADYCQLDAALKMAKGNV